MPLHDPVVRQAMTPARLALVTQPGGGPDRLLVHRGLLSRLLTEDGLVVERLAEVIPELYASVDKLNRALAPLSEPTNRVPAGRRHANAPLEV